MACPQDIDLQNQLRSILDECIHEAQIGGISLVFNPSAVNNLQPTRMVTSSIDAKRAFNIVGGVAFLHLLYLLNAKIEDIALSATVSINSSIIMNPGFPILVYFFSCSISSIFEIEKPLVLYFYLTMGPKRRT